MKYCIAMAAVLVAATAEVASAAGECIWDINYDTPIGMHDPAGQLLRCWLQTQGGDWECSQYECTNRNIPEWSYRATYSVCSGDTCEQTVVNDSDDVVISGTSGRGPNAFTTVKAIDYRGRNWACDTVSDSPGSGTGIFYTIMCPQ